MSDPPAGRRAQPGGAPPRILTSPGRLLVAFFLVLALPMGAMLGLALQQLRQVLELQARGQNLVAARLATRLVKEHLDGSTRYVGSHARSQSLARAVANGDARVVEERLADLVLEQARFDRVYVADARGVLLYDFPPAPGSRGRSFAHLDWFRGAEAARGPYVSMVYQRLAAPAPYVVAIAAPIRGPRGEARGYLVAQELASELSAVAASARPTAASEVVWVDRAGQAFGGGPAPPRSLAASPPVRAALAGREGADSAADPRTGAPIVLGYAPVPGYGGAVIVRQPLAEVYGPIDRLRGQVLALGLGTLAAMLGLGGVLVAALGRHQVHLVRVEDELRRSRDELEAVSYSLSHDLRTPLRGIAGFAQILLEEQGGRLDEEGRDHLRRVREASQVMGQQLDAFVDLLAVARAELRREAVDLAEVAREVAGRLAAAEPGRQVALDVEDGLVVDGDPKLLRQVLTCLLQNAWKFTRGREPGHVALRRVRDAAGHPTEAFVVADDGEGFDMAYVEKLFRPFERLHAPGNGSLGSGMGLAIVRRAVERHGGQVWAESAPGLGARFYFSLPGG